jgi:hypothetical protein
MGAVYATVWFLWAFLCQEALADVSLERIYMAAARGASRPCGLAKAILREYGF